MWRRLPGEETAGLVSTSPGTPVVFRPTVVPTPAFITIIILTWRLIWGALITIYLHPIAASLVAATATATVVLGWKVTLFGAGAVASALALWANLAFPSFLTWVGWPLLAFWRWLWIYRRHWLAVVAVSGLGRSLKGRDFTPHLVGVRCDGQVDRVTVKMLKGQSDKEWCDRSPNLAHGFGATSCRVSVEKAGRLVLTFPRRDPLAVPLPARPLPEWPSVGPVEIGQCEDGTPYKLKVHGTHILIAGATGAGKGSWLWSVIRGLLPAARAGLVQLWAMDPKLMELSFGRSLFHRYADAPEDCAYLLEEAVKVMQERAARYAGVRRNHVPTIADPFILLLVDELAFLTAYQADKGLKQRITAALATLTTQGRAVGVGVMAALQDPRKDVVSIRNLFPDKVALRLDESEQVDMVLGDGARDRGALADLISPDPAIGAGVGYVWLETSPDPVRVRAAYVSDNDIRHMVLRYGRGTGEAL
ncbi:hypothetical cell division FtsK/SpoIIIE protein [Microtetraspora sp. NBRC 13810]|uniref:FtsK/SpoIIIE domain-containing protein n=1 Tax=Microtetraspora sp. NBRC 13810 TaxID=3030990 RepID=UPI0024A21326|nr:FtsK/SpoIIIE domain-containing protein [Microtetraspora sp. NBRC 13810]GLW10318.1 hypothetical cell division FtsK/SpoIIIE protein [Microtetraspora sp. NBRC 13810]